MTVCLYLSIVELPFLNEGPTLDEYSQTLFYRVDDQWPFFILSGNEISTAILR